MNSLKVITTAFVTFAMFTEADVHAQAPTPPSPPVTPKVLSKAECIEICRQSSILKLTATDQKNMLKQCTLQKYCSEDTGFTADIPIPLLQGIIGDREDIIQRRNARPRY
jgi:hypothetical protein